MCTVRFSLLAPAYPPLFPSAYICERNGHYFQQYSTSLGADSKKQADGGKTKTLLSAPLAHTRTTQNHTLHSYMDYLLRTTPFLTWSVWGIVDTTALSRALSTESFFVPR